MDFDLNTGIQFMLHGCFEAPDEQWKHVSRRLDSFELFLVLDGTLYVSDNCNNYTVNISLCHPVKISTDGSHHNVDFTISTGMQILQKAVFLSVEASNALIP